ncbi:AAC_HP2_G0009670.mRNA.1.CDS.1 [Saccharomyces cerevisiae]|nr:AAC_HP2_G0009670.mRNA.1.CDS.1 [Saccharomyces cerevisiae]CAI6432487.1 AAC_HP2_G0009670.mRNA.1.CDS.1 [Saccharomyces cerevisiae]CAI6436762.1 AAC_HP1_G0010760.mRNA.1.CDS.1 [Saccharomyces cerevisiae]
MSWNLLFVLLIGFVVLILLSPVFKSAWPFSTFYRNVFQPFLVDDQKYRWKFHLVPLFYTSIYLYLVYTYHRRVESTIKNELFLLERILIVPIIILPPVALGILAMVSRAEDSKDHKSGSTEEYPYDYLLYYPAIKCSTCRIVKPARSKHCSICNRCVLVADHHCIWINNCIGKGNYLQFYLFLISNIFSMCYAFLRLWYISLNSTNTLPRAVLTLTILCGCFIIICAIFTYLQLAIVKEGMTTNEQDKWYTIQEYMREGKLVRSLDDDCPSWFFKCTEQKDDAAEPLQDQHVTFYSTNAYDHKHYNLTHYITIKDASEIPNIYDKGTFLANLTDLI